mmetsp:Transcript_27421/g.45994  ORF Transcript_27421/g.45994 Transcript_27421/m.45994 type:complete len:397 (-) Transcript_27421:800-1990(-)
MNSLRIFALKKRWRGDGRMFSTVMSSAVTAEKELAFFKNKKQTPVSMKSFADAGKSTEGPNNTDRALCQIACFLHKELPIRVAHAVDHLRSPVFMASENMRKVCSEYEYSFMELRNTPLPSNADNRALYTELLQNHYDLHSSTLVSVAKGLYEVRASLNATKEGFADTYDVQKRIDEFYFIRIGIRLLADQYLELCKPRTDPNMIGLVDLQASPYEIAKEAIADAEYMCRRAHGDAPEVIVLGRKDLHFPYVSSHLHYMLVELLKNSMRAVVETHGIDDMPPIKVVIADGEENEDVVIKVSDEGGGIKRSRTQRVWGYLYSTADPAVLEQMLDQESGEYRDFNTSAPLAGLGYGLPIARNYARYFGGELTVMSTEGYGTDGYIHLPRLGKSSSTII